MTMFLFLEMFALGAPRPLYYTEQKAKIGTIELSLKPSVENQYAVEISSKCLRVRIDDFTYLPDIWSIFVSATLNIMLEIFEREIFYLRRPDRSRFIIDSINEPCSSYLN